MTSAKKSPSRRKYGSNGKVKVTRINLRCLCSEIFEVLVCNSNAARALCPRCHQYVFGFVFNRRHDVLNLDVGTRELRQEVQP